MNVMARRVNLCRGGGRLYEIELRDTTGRDRFADEYGFPTNPPIVLCAKSVSNARKQLKLPRGVKVVKVKRG